MPGLTEDEIYRASSQFRFWSFTPSKLKSMRNETNSLACENIKTLLQRRKNLQVSSADATPSVSDAESKAGSIGKAKKDSGEAECLTPDEEEELMKFYCNNLLYLGLTEFRYPANVTGTAIQFLKRFYLTHSLMDYPPKKIMPTALFLATKTENWTTFITTFLEEAHRIEGLHEITKDSVLSPEFVFTQALRFHFDIKHPFRALKGFWLECTLLMTVCKGGRAPAGWSRKSDEEIRKMFMNGKPPAVFENTTTKGYEKTKAVLQSAALLSDVYFYYSPSQICFAAWYTHDPAFIINYLELKLTGTIPAATKYKIEDTIKDCAELLQEFKVPEVAVLKKINRKMNRCNELTNTDLVAENKARKRGGDASGVDENKAKKRKLERETLQKQGEDLFGGALVKPQE